MELTAGAYTLNGHVVYWVGSIAAGVKALYSFHPPMRACLATPVGSRNAYTHMHEASLLLGAPLLFLAVLSVYFGRVARTWG